MHVRVVCACVWLEARFVRTYTVDRSPLGVFKANETQSTNWDNKRQQLLRISNVRRKTSWLFTSWTRDYQNQIQRMVQNEPWIRDLSETNPRLASDLEACALTTGPHCIRSNFYLLTCARARRAARRTCKRAKVTCTCKSLLKLIMQGEKPETSTKTCNETMLRDKLRAFVSRISPS